MDATGSSTGATGFGRMLVVLDGSAEAQAATAFAEGASGRFGTVASFVELAEQTTRRRSERTARGVRNGRHATICRVSGPTAGARNRLLAARIAEAARESGADVIVLGVDHRRLAHHRLAASLRSRLAAATDLPVLVVPTSGTGRTGEPGAGGQTVLPGEKAEAPEAGRLAHV
jgi:nucleotide-binding universal stress UspA family protein